jgi:hypothetical protein
VLLERWPELGWALRADPTLMGRLEERATDQHALAALIDEVAPEVTALDDLAAFLKDALKLAPFIERLIYCQPAMPTGTG